jgi:hypothetical protein
LCQLDFQLRHQIIDRLAAWLTINETPVVTEAPPVLERLPMHRAPFPPCALETAGGSNERCLQYALIGLPAFLEGLDTLFFFAALAFGLRVSLARRICPLAMVLSF